MALRSIGNTMDSSARPKTTVTNSSSSGRSSIEDEFDDFADEDFDFDDADVLVEGELKDNFVVAICRDDKSARFHMHTV